MSKIITKYISRRMVSPVHHHTRFLSTITVLGGGVTGTSIVAVLVDAGHDVTWIDEKYSDLGRFGKYYRNGVPANTVNHVLVSALKGVKSFEYSRFLDNCIQKDLSTSLSDLPGDTCADLNYLYEPLMFASTQLRAHPNVTAVQGKLIHAKYSNSILDNPWTFTVSKMLDDSEQATTCMPMTLRSSIFMIASGARPSLPLNISPNSPHQNVDVFVNSRAVHNIMEGNSRLRDEKWAVVGSSHR
jgi:hypothetical protein